MVTDQVDAAVRAWSSRVRDTNDEQFVEAMTSRNLSRPDHSRRVGRWRENLSVDEARIAASMVADTARSFGYDLSELGP